MHFTETSPKLTKYFHLCNLFDYFVSCISALLFRIIQVVRELKLGQQRQHVLKLDINCLAFGHGEHIRLLKLKNSF